MLDGNIPYQVKVVNSNLVTFVKWIPIVDWYIGVLQEWMPKRLAQNMVTILDSIGSIIGKT